jgi:hypothetical protein
MAGYEHKADSAGGDLVGEHIVQPNDGSTSSASEANAHGGQLGAGSGGGQEWRHGRCSLDAGVASKQSSVDIRNNLNVDWDVFVEA